MSGIIANDLVSDHDVIFNIIFNNPDLLKVQGEIGEPELIKYAIDEYEKNNENLIFPKDIRKCLEFLEEQSLINRKRYQNSILITSLKTGSKNSLTGEEINESEKSKNSISYFIGDNGENNTIKSLIFLHLNNRELSADPVIKYLPDLFELSCNIINDPYTDWHTQLILSSALGYFILEQDVVPDHLDEGYLDDIYILSYALNEVMEHNSPHIIKNYWKKDEDPFKVIKFVLGESQSRLKGCDLDVLHKVGLKRLKNLELRIQSRGMSSEIQQLKLDNSEMLAITAYLFDIIFSGRKRIHNIEDIRNILKECSQYNEILRLVEIHRQDLRIDNPIAETKPLKRKILDIIDEDQ